MSVKKVCFVTTILSTAAAFTGKQVKLLIERGYSVTVLSSGGDEKQFADYLQGVEFIPIRIQRGVSLPGLFTSVIDLFHIIKHKQFDLIIYATPNAAFSCSIAGWLARSPIRLYCQMGLRYTGFSGIRRMLFKQFEIITCSLSTHIEPVSKLNMDFAITEGLFPAHKGFLVGNGGSLGIDLSVFDSNYKAEWRKEIRLHHHLPENALVYGYVGRITKDKGINELFAAFKNILTRFPESWLILVGEIEDEDGLDQDLLRWARECSKVVWCGHSTMVKKFFAAMDVFVFPTYREGLPQVALEAQAMSAAIITTDTPGPKDAIMPGKSALLVPPKDPVRLEQAMEQLANNSALRDRIGQEGLRNVKEKFDDQVFLPLLIERRELLLRQTGR